MLYVGFIFKVMSNAFRYYPVCTASTCRYDACERDICTCALIDPWQWLEISPWTGRFYSLLDPSYAKNNIPIIASVSEHQPTTWSSFYFDLQMLTIMFPGQLLSRVSSS